MECPQTNKKQALALIFLLFFQHYCVGNASATGSHASNRLFEQGMDLGVGLDSINSLVITSAHCLEDFELRKLNTTNSVSYTYHLARNRTELMKRLGVQASVSGIVISVFTFGLSGGFDLYREGSKDSLYLVLQMDVITGEYGILNPRLSLDGAEENRYGTEPGTIRHYYRNNYEKFRRLCGDLFLNVITTGGRYYGILEIKADSSYVHKEFNLSLTGSFDPLSIRVTGGLSFVLEEYKNWFGIDFYKVSRGDDRVDKLFIVDDTDTTGDEVDAEQIAQYISRFENEINAFQKTILENEHVIENGQVQTDEQGKPIPRLDYRKGAYLAKFEPYSQIVPELESNSTIESDQLIATEYQDEIVAYNALKADIEHILSHPDEFIDVDKSELWDMLAEIEWYSAVLEDATYLCGLPRDRICMPLSEMIGEGAQIRIKTAFELRQGEEGENDKGGLPKKKIEIASNCMDHQRLYGADTSGEYLVYLDQDITKPFMIYCDEMEKDEEEENERNDGKPDKPKEYLTLPVTSQLTENPRFNYAQYVALCPDKNTAANCDDLVTLTTVYEKVRVQINNDGLTVFNEQEKFVQTNLYEVFDTEGQGHRIARFGTSKSAHFVELRGANINLTNTPFVISNQVEFGVHERQFEVIEDRLCNWQEAQQDASNRRGRLPIIFNEFDNQKYQAILELYGIQASWIGLRKCTSQSNCFDSYSWSDPRFAYLPYRNWAEDEHFNGDGVSLDSNGKWSSNPSGSIWPYIVVYQNTRSHVESSFSNQDDNNPEQVDIYLSSDFGQTGTVGPKRDLVLLYSRNKAEQLF